jgi:tRNA(Ile)-lysidine synthase
MIPAATDDEDALRLIVALSGGADSVCLLHVLRDLQYKPEACHVNHKLRGEASDNDEKFVRELCKQLEVKLHVRQIDVKALQKKHQSIEEAAREARYSYFAEFGSGAIIATAHTSNDNTETVLLNLIRGTGLRGLCGIPPVRDKIIRPLIETAREEVEAYLKEKAIKHITDESNFSDEFTRNNLRLNVIPLLEKINPSLNAAVTRMCSNLYFDWEHLHGIAALALEKVGTAGVYKIDVLLNQPPAILHRIISLILSKNNISPTSKSINAIISILKAGERGKVNLAKDKFAIVSGNMLYIETIQQDYKKND